MRQRPTLPGRLQPSTIGVLRLNFCVRNGNRWNPQAITTASGEQDCGGRSVSVLLFQALFSAESSPVLSDSSLSFGLAFACLWTHLFLLSFLSSGPLPLPSCFQALRFSACPLSGTPGLPSCILTTVYEIRDQFSISYWSLLKIN